MSTAEQLTKEQIVEKAIDTLGTVEKARGWLAEPNLAMGGRVPNDLLDAEDGREWVRTILGRIEYGIYS